jgi:hypothetical protein
MMDVIYLLDGGDSCNNSYFNDAIPSSDEYSLDVVPVSFGYDPHNAETWKELSSAESLQLYKDKNVLHYAAVQFVIDSSKKVHMALSMDDTHEGQLCLKEKKRLECAQRKLLAKLDSKKAKPDGIGSS